ncbi:MAG TPA: CpaF family protein, partial [Candidatus Dormibacteraeota bacterium]
IRGQISSAINIVVQTERLRGGARKIVSVSEVFGLHDGEIGLNEVFTFKQISVTPDGRAVGYHTATGTGTTFEKHFKSNGIDLPENMFEPTPEPAAEALY